MFCSAVERCAGAAGEAGDSVLDPYPPKGVEGEATAVPALEPMKGNRSLYCMMDHIKFETRIEENGVLRIPESYSHELRKGENVRVTVSETPKEKPTVTFLREHPLHAPGFKPMSRDELYGRP